MSWQNFQQLQVTLSQSAPFKRRYSITSDVLPFQTCRRQYGYFAVQGYEPVNDVQIYYGTLIHQVLDRAHRHYRESIDPKTGLGEIPTDQDIQRYFHQVDSALRVRGVRAFGVEREAALRRLKLFNRIEGSQLYPRIRDTEHRLQSDRGDYLLHGVVDVLADDPNWLPGMGAEIWDYKGGHPPKKREEFRRYEFQMLVYAQLYRERNGILPVKAVLYFLGELDKAEESLMRPEGALVEVTLHSHRIQQALQVFSTTVGKIEYSRLHNDWSAPSPEEAPEKQTCDACDIRWDCPTRAGEYKMRYP